LLGGRMVDYLKPLVKPSSALSNMKVFIAHGSKDQTINVERAREANGYLRGLGLQPEYKEYPVGHEISQDMMVGLNEWLKK